MDITTKPRLRVRAAGLNSFAMDSGLTTEGAIMPAAGTAAYHAASVGRRMASWRPAGSGPNAIVEANAGELVRRSRDARRNQPMARRTMSLLTTHIVGSGIKPRSICKNAKVRAALGEMWTDWSTVCDADGTLDFYGLQSLACSEMVEAGEAFVRLRTRRIGDGLPVPLQLQLIPSEQVPLSYSPGGGAEITQAIERDQIGRRTAYWMLRQHPGDYRAGYASSSLDPVRVAAADVAHLYNVARIGQMRGLPWLSAAVTTLYQINSFLDAELLRKQIVASIVGFVKTPTPEPVDPADVRATYGQITQPDVPGDLPNVSMEPGSMQYLDAGQDVIFNNPADVGGNFEAFLAASYRSVAAATDLIFEELTGDWRATNDRTFRAMFATFKRTVRQWQYNLLAMQFGTPIWTRFIDYAVSSGAIKVPKSVNDMDLYRCEWRPERWEYIHPVQDVSATGEAIALGLTSRSAEVAERGDDIEEIDRQIAADHAREEQLGLSFGTATPQGSDGAGGAGDTAPSPGGKPAPAKPGTTQAPNSAPPGWE